MASQYAGWAIDPEGFFAMGSGPLRAKARVEKELFGKLGYAEEAERGVLVLEGRTLPGDDVAEWVAKQDWIDFLAEAPETRSCTSICLAITAPWFAALPPEGRAEVDGCARVYPVADEDLERENDAKTSSVHVLRFELDAAMRARLRGGAGLELGVDHPAYRASIVATRESREALAADLA